MAQPTSGAILRNLLALIWGAAVFTAALPSPVGAEIWSIPDKEMGTYCKIRDSFPVMLGYYNYAPFSPGTTTMGGQMGDSFQIVVKLDSNYESTSPMVRLYYRCAVTRAGGIAIWVDTVWTLLKDSIRVLPYQTGTVVWLGFRGYYPGYIAFKETLFSGDSADIVTTIRPVGVQTFKITAGGTITWPNADSVYWALYSDTALFAWHADSAVYAETALYALNGGLDTSKVSRNGTLTDDSTAADPVVHSLRTKGGLSPGFMSLDSVHLGIIGSDTFWRIGRGGQVLGGLTNRIKNGGQVVGGSLNYCGAPFSGIGGNAQACTIGTKSSPNQYSVIGGGYHNVIPTGWAYSTICGGRDNKLGEGCEFIGGGQGNTVTSGGSGAEGSGICGGKWNYVTTENYPGSVAGYGYADSVLVEGGTAVGGFHLVTKGAGATACGGSDNKVCAPFGFASGEDCTVDSQATHGFAFGHDASAFNQNHVTFNWGDDSTGEMSIDSNYCRTNPSGLHSQLSVKGNFAADSGWFETGVRVGSTSTHISGTKVTADSFEGHLIYPNGDSVLWAANSGSSGAATDTSKVSRRGDASDDSTAAWPVVKTLRTTDSLGFPFATWYNADGKEQFRLGAWGATAADTGLQFRGNLMFGDANHMDVTYPGFYEAPQVCGGNRCTTQAVWATIVNGRHSFIGTGGQHSFIGSSDESRIQGTGYSAIVAGGSVIDSGTYDFAGTASQSIFGTSATNAVIVSGNQNRVNDEFSFIGNGDYNEVDSNKYATVLNGAYDSAYQYCATVLGGVHNRAHGNYATVLNGNRCTADDTLSMSWGRGAHAYKNQFVAHDSATKGATIIGDTIAAIYAFRFPDNTTQTTAATSTADSAGGEWTRDSIVARQGVRIGTSTTHIGPTNVTADSFFGDGSALTGIGATAATALSFTGKVNEALGVVVGTPVYISGGTGSLPQVSKADRHTATKYEVAGMAAEAKANNQNVLVRVAGLLTGVNTTGKTEGNPVYLDTNGTWTTTAPTKGQRLHIGWIVDAASNGRILVGQHKEPYMSAAANQDVDLRMGTGTSNIIFEDSIDGHIGTVDNAGNLVMTGYVEGDSFRGTARTAALFQGLDTTALMNLLYPIGWEATWPGKTVPNAHWVWEDGAAYDSATYPAAGYLLKPIYGGVAGKFNVPDMRGFWERGAPTYASGVGDTTRYRNDTTSTLSHSGGDVEPNTTGLIIAAHGVGQAGNSGDLNNFVNDEAHNITDNGHDHNFTQPASHAVKTAPPSRNRGYIIRIW